MDQVKAQELLDDPHYGPYLSMEGFRKLLLRAGYPAHLANEAAKQRGWDRLVAGEVQ